MNNELRWRDIDELSEECSPENCKKLISYMRDTGFLDKNRVSWGNYYFVFSEDEIEKAHQIIVDFYKSHYKEGRDTDIYNIIMNELSGVSPEYPFVFMFSIRGYVESLNGVAYFELIEEFSHYLDEEKIIQEDYYDYMENAHPELNKGPFKTQELSMSIIDLIR